MNVTILGLGAVGSRVALELARVLDSFLYWSSEPHINIVDDGFIELKNTRNQIYSPRHVGQKKATIARHLMSDISSISATAYHNHVDESSVTRLLRNCGLVIDCLDNASARIAVASECLVQDIPCLHVGMNVGYGGIRWNSNAYTVSDDDGAPDICTSDLAPGLGQFVAAAAVSVILRYLTHKEFVNLTIGIENFSVIAS